MNVFGLFQRSLTLQGYRWSANIFLWSFVLFVIFTGLIIFNTKKCQLATFVTMQNRDEVHSSTSTTGAENLTKVLVVAHYNEDVAWIDLFLGNKLPHIVYTQSRDPLAVHKFPINRGREAVVYLRYIVDHYEKLPSLVAFVHAHRKAGHQTDPSDIVVALRAVRWNKYPFMPLTSSRTISYFRLGTVNTVEAVNLYLWQEVLQKELGPPPPNGINTHCCATFVVRREAILKHSRAFYARIMEYILTTTHSDAATSQTLEFTWHLIFGEKPELKYETCDIFFCDSNGTISIELAEKQLM